MEHKCLIILFHVYQFINIRRLLILRRNIVDKWTTILYKHGKLNGMLRMIARHHVSYFIKK